MVDLCLQFLFPKVSLEFPSKTDKHRVSVYKTPSQYLSLDRIWSCIWTNSQYTYRYLDPQLFSTFLSWVHPPYIEEGYPFSIFFYSRLLCLLYDLTPCTLILSSNSVWHVTAQIDPFSPIITWASILFYNHQFLESQPLVVCFHNPLDFCPFTLVGFRVIAPALHPAHIGDLTLSSRLGRMHSVHNKIIFL